MQGNIFGKECLGYISARGVSGSYVGVTFRLSMNFAKSCKPCIRLASGVDHQGCSNRDIIFIETSLVAVMNVLCIRIAREGTHQAAEI